MCTAAEGHCDRYLLDTLLFEEARRDAAQASFNVLSGGEQEQIYLATRLALTEVLAKEECQLVVLDDVLTATDTARLARIMTILEESARKLQILILTCHPERYGGLSGANLIDLARLMENNNNF